jgi:hypothetical protein
MTGPIINLDKERHLRITLNAMIEFEKRTGKDMTNLKVSEMTISDIRLLLWQCLLWEDPTLTEEQVGSMIGLDNMRDVMNALNQLIVVNPTSGPAERKDSGPSQEQPLT